METQQSKDNNRINFQEFEPLNINNHYNVWSKQQKTSHNPKGVKRVLSNKNKKRRDF